MRCKQASCCLSRGRGRESGIDESSRVSCSCCVSAMSVLSIPSPHTHIFICAASCGLTVVATDGDDFVDHDGKLGGSDDEDDEDNDDGDDDDDDDGDDGEDAAGAK